MKTNLFFILNLLSQGFDVSYFNLYCHYIQFIAAQFTIVVEYHIHYGGDKKFDFFYE